jgi:hypothetical protein
MQLSVSQAAVAAELAEWREDVTERGIGSQVVVLAVPRGWGRSVPLGQVADDAEVGDDGPVMLVARVSGDVSGCMAVQAQAVAGAVARAWQEPGPAARAAGLLDLDTTTGKAQLGLGVAGLFVPGGLAVQAGLLAVSLGVTAAGNARDASPAG